MVIHWAQLGEHTSNLLWGTVIAGGCAFVLKEIYRLGVKGYTASWIDPRWGNVSAEGKIAYFATTWQIYKSADLIFERLGWREEISRNLTSVSVGAISSLSLIEVAKNSPVAAYIVTCLTVWQLALCTIGGLLIMADGAKGMVSACSGIPPATP